MTTVERLAAKSSGMRKPVNLGLFRFHGSISRRSYILVFISSLVLLVGIWYLITSFTSVPSQLVPSPQKVAAAMVKMLYFARVHRRHLGKRGPDRRCFSHLRCTGCPTRVVDEFRLRSLRRWWSPSSDFIRYVPVPALIPIFIIWSGIGETSKFFVLFFGTFFQLVLFVMDDADNVPRLYFDLARTLGASTPELIRDVLVPFLLPMIYDRLRVTLGWCWTYLIIAELIAVERGIGHTIKEAQRLVPPIRCSFVL